MSDAGNSPGADAETPPGGPGSWQARGSSAVPPQPSVIYGPYTKGSGATSPSAQPPVRQQPAPYGPQPPARSFYGQSMPAAALPYAPTQPLYAAPGGGNPSHPATGSAPIRTDYARWSRRALALLVDDVPALIATAVFFIGYGLFLAALFRSSSTGLPPNGRLLMLVGAGSYVVALGWTIYNRWITAGRTGQSVGKRLTRIALVSEITNQPVGAFYAFLRDLVHILDGLAYVGFLWPLWDEKRQTFADKLLRTIVVTAP